MRKRNLCLFIFALIASLVFVFTNAVAEETNTGEGLTISPPISEPKIESGESLDQTIRITNTSGRMIEVYPQTMDLKASGEDGRPSFYNAGDSNSKFSLASWISYVPAAIALMPEQVVDFKYTISVPIDAEPGGHYGAVFFVSNPGSTGNGSSQVAISSMIGSLVLVEVPGDVTEKGNIVDFGTDSTLYLKGNNVNIGTRIANVGNVHFRPIGNIIVKNMFGKQVGNLVFNEQGGNVLPESARKFENNWGYNWKNFGKFTANLGIVYGESGNSLAASYSFWIIPYWLIIAIIFIIIILILTTWLIIRFLRNRKKKKITRKNESPREFNDINRPNGGRPPVILR